MENPYESSEVPAVEIDTSNSPRIRPRSSKRLREIERIDLMSCAKLLGALGAIMGLIGGVVFALMTHFGPFADISQGRDETDPILLIGYGVIVVAPIAYGLVGVLYGLLIAGIYNIVASLVGGVKIRLSD